MDNLVELIEASCRKFKDRELFGTKAGESWSWLTYGQFKPMVDELRAGLAGLGIGPGDRVALVADNCVEWAAAAYATYGLGAIFVPMYTAQVPDEWKFILEDCGAKVVFGADERTYKILKTIQAELPSLEHAIGISLPESAADSYSGLRAKGRSAAVPPIFPASSDIAGYIYTSGTTGRPKGVMLSHGNLSSNVLATSERFPLHRERSLAFLPWAHAFGQIADLHFFVHGGHTITINDDIAELIPNLAVVRPTMLIAVPRIFNRIYDGVNKQMAAKPAPIQALFRRGLLLAGKKNGGGALGVLDGLLLAVADKLIFSKVRARFGGRLKLVVSSSAALNEEVALFIDALGIMVYEGYGLTETSPAATLNYPGNRRIGSVGKAIPDTRVVIDESKSGTSGEGEVLLYGPNIMQGYYKQPEATAAVLMADGGFRTGDLGRLDEQGYLYITGRIKEQYKLENGKYVAPAALEETLKLSPFIANVMLYGANKPHNVALVVPDQDSLKAWAAEGGLTLGALETDEQVQTLLQRELEKHGADFRGYEKPRKMLIVLDDFTTENGLLTPSLKLKRNKALELYQSRLDALFG